MEHEIVRSVAAAQKDAQAADALVRQYLPFIKAETAKFLKRIPVEGKDDEFGIAMFAFHEAAMAYQSGRGTFLKLAACHRVLSCAREHPVYLEQLTTTGKLPIAALSAESGVERKTMERHRKYLVALLLAFTNGFEIIRGHLRQMARPVKEVK